MTNTTQDQDARALEALRDYQPAGIGQTIACETVKGWGEGGAYGDPHYVYLTIEDTRDGSREVADVRAWVELTQWHSIQEAARAVLEGRATLDSAAQGPEVWHLPALEAAGVVKGGKVDRERVERLTADGIDRIRVDAEGRALVPLHEAMFPRAREPRAVSWRALAEITAHTFYDGNGGQTVQHYAHLRGLYGSERLEVSEKARDAAEAEILEAVRTHAPHVLEPLTAGDAVEIHAATVASRMASEARHALSGGHYGVWREIPSELTRGKGSPDGSVDLPSDAEMRRRAVAIMLSDAEIRAAVIDALSARGVAVGVER